MTKRGSFPIATSSGRGASGGSLDRSCSQAKNLTKGRRCCVTTSRSNRSEEHTSELQSLAYLVCRLLLEKKKKKQCRAKAWSHPHPPPHSTATRNNAREPVPAL